MGSTGAGASDDRIAIENVNHPGKRTMVDGRKYRAMRAALVAVLPDGPPGLTEAAFREAVLAHLPEAVSRVAPPRAGGRRPSSSISRPGA